MSIMHIHAFAATIAVVSAFMFAGCADQRLDPGSSPAAASTTDPTERTYGRKEIDRSGRRTTPDAIQAMDPASRISTDQ